MDAQARWSKPFGDFNHRWLSALFHPIGPVQHFLNGTWLGHPVHAVVTDVPIGAMTVSIAADLIGQPVAADVSMVLGVLAMVAAAVTGLADYTEVDGNARSRATVHGTLMIITLVLYLVTLGMRAGSPPDRLVPIAIALVAYLILALSSAIGGDLVYLLGTHVDRHIRAEPARSGSPSISAACRTPRGGPTKLRLGVNEPRSCATARRSSRSMPSAPTPAGRSPKAALSMARSSARGTDRASASRTAMSAGDPRCTTSPPTRSGAPTAAAGRRGASSADRPAGPRASSSRVQYDSDEPGTERRPSERVTIGGNR